MNGYRKSHKILKVGPDAFLEHCKQNLTFAGFKSRLSLIVRVNVVLNRTVVVVDSD